MVKPDPRIFHLSLERLCVQPNEAVFVDDMVENVGAAQREGLITILHRENRSTITELNRYLASE
jgi:2-haloacid dehalogenase